MEDWSSMMIDSRTATFGAPDEAHFAPASSGKGDFSAVYEPLRSIARAYMRRERRTHTLQPTALVHEAFMRLAKRLPADGDRQELFCAMARAMRAVLIDHARRRAAHKRDPAAAGVALPAADRWAADPVNLMVVDEAVQRLAEIDPELTRIVELRFFAGLSEEESASVLGVSARTVRRGWSVAKLWLARELRGD
jgi:RNA polymerase sigma factor (TIGR02999 family)